MFIPRIPIPIRTRSMTDVQRGSVPGCSSPVLPKSLALRTEGENQKAEAVIYLRCYYPAIFLRPTRVLLHTMNINIRVLALGVDRLSGYGHGKKKPVLNDAVQGS